MYPLLSLSALVQIACIVHAVRTRRAYWWIFILMAGSFIGVAAYVIAELLPDLRHNRAARQVLNQAHDRIDPERRKRMASRQLDVADTLDNRKRLAQECFDSGDYAQAAEMYRSGLRGLYATDPDLLLGLARAQFALAQPAEAKQTLDALIAANPDFRSPEGHLVYARCLEAVDDLPAALHEYAALVDGYPGEEARVRYGQLLSRAGRNAEAADVFRTSIKRTGLAPKYYQRQQKAWVETAKRELAALPA
ncbi:MAG: tetratricopeptide repeat protein [Lysobacteraceae bacterium]